jgi:hypothetical protein
VVHKIFHPMKVYILKNKDGEFGSHNFAIAYDGFRKMGWEIVTFTQQDNPLLPDLTPCKILLWRLATTFRSASYRTFDRSL